MTFSACQKYKKLITTSHITYVSKPKQIFYIPHSIVLLLLLLLFTYVPSLELTIIHKNIYKQSYIIIHPYICLSYTYYILHTDYVYTMYTSVSDIV